MLHRAIFLATCNQIMSFAHGRFPAGSWKNSCKQSPASLCKLRKNIVNMSRSKFQKEVTETQENIAKASFTLA